MVGERSKSVCYSPSFSALGTVPCSNYVFSQAPTPASLASRWIIPAILLPLSGLFNFCFFFLGPHLEHMEVPRRGQIAAAAGLCHSHSDRGSEIYTAARGNTRSFNPLSEARDWTCIFMDTNQFLNLLNHNGNSPSDLFKSVMASYTVANAWIPSISLTCAMYSLHQISVGSNEYGFFFSGWTQHICQFYVFIRVLSCLYGKEWFFTEKSSFELGICLCFSMWLD